VDKCLFEPQTTLHGNNVGGEQHGASPGMSAHFARTMGMSPPEGKVSPPAANRRFAERASQAYLDWLKDKSASASPVPEAFDVNQPSLQFGNNWPILVNWGRFTATYILTSHSTTSSSRNDSRTFAGSSRYHFTVHDYAM
jgi:hypothetical protein